MPKDDTKPRRKLGEEKYEDWPELLMPSEVGDLFRVSPKTISRWGKDGKIPDTAIVLTLGSHRRYRKEFIYKIFVNEGVSEGETE